METNAIPVATEAPADTTPIWGYPTVGEPKIFYLKGDELLPEGYYDSPQQAKTEGINQQAERELRAELERRAAAVKLEIDAAWTTQRLQNEVHRKEVMENAKVKVAPKKVDASSGVKPEDAVQPPNADRYQQALAAVQTPPVGESGAEMGQRAERIDQQQAKAAELLKEDTARKRAAADEDGKAKKPERD